MDNQDLLSTTDGVTEHFLSLASLPSSPPGAAAPNSAHPQHAFLNYLQIFFVISEMVVGGKKGGTRISHSITWLCNVIFHFNL